MTFDKLVYHESAGPDPGSVLTVDFGGIGELTVRSGLRGEVNWRRLTRPVLDILRLKLASCDFEEWRDDAPAPEMNGTGWGLELFDGGKSVKQVNGGNVPPEQWAQFQSILELCDALAENRRQRLHCSCAGLRSGTGGSSGRMTADRKNSPMDLKSSTKHGMIYTQKTNQKETTKQIRKK